MENPSDEELVDWDDDDDYPIDGIVEDDQFLSEENLSCLEIEQHFEVLIANQLTDIEPLPPSGRKIP